MPIEESANIVILAAAISNIDGNTDWADRYWTTLTKWTNYLVENGQDPENQLCTDDFAGHLAHNANLAVKAIMGVAGYAMLCAQRGETDNFVYYMGKAREMATEWVRLAREGTHFKLAYDRTGTWSQKYNMVWDKAWGTSLFTDAVKNQEYTFYMDKLKAYGLPLDSRSSWTKSDWEMWTAALARNNTNFFKISNLVWNYVNKTPSRVPLSDWYFSDGQGAMTGFRARSVVGGHWMKVYVDKMLNGDIGSAIAPIQAQEEQSTPSSMLDGWYNLSGQRVDAPSQKGIYIRNGKKVAY